MKNKSLKITCIILLILMLIPIPLKLKDGGTVLYKAVLYSVYDYHILSVPREFNENGERKYDEGIGVYILGFTVYDNVYDF